MRKYKKSYKTKRRRSFNILKNRFFWFGFLAFIIISGLVYLFVFSSVFKIKEIQVSGYESASIKNIISNTVSNIFVTNFNEIRQKSLEQYPKIKEIKLKREFPNKISAEVEEKIAIASFYYKPLTSLSILPFKEEIKEYYLIDDQGIVFEIVSEIPDLPIIELNSSITYFDLGQQAVEKAIVNNILKINSKLKDNLTISRNYLISNKRLDIKTSDSWEIYFNLDDDIDWQIEKLNVLLRERIPFDKRKNLKYIDLRFERTYIFPDDYLED
jgi:cell division septal protein FtsQ